MIMTIRQRIGCVLISMLFVGAVIMGIMYPAGNDPMTARSCAMAARGLHLWHMMSRMNAKSSICLNHQMCFNATEYIERLVAASRDCGIGLYSESITNSDWNIAVDFPNDCDSTFPVLISANFNLQYLGCHYDDDVVVPLGIKSGAPMSLLEDRVVVVVRKSGMVQRISAKSCTKQRILGVLTNGMSSITYLTPGGRMTINLKASHK